MNFLPKIKSTLIGLAALIIAPGVASADQFALMDRVEGGTGAEVMLGAIIVEDADGLVVKNDYHFQILYIIFHSSHFSAKNLLDSIPYEVKLALFHS